MTAVLRIRQPSDALVHAVLVPGRPNRPALFSEGAGRIEIPSDFTGVCVLFARDHAPLRLEVAGSPPESVDLPGVIRLSLQVWTHQAADHVAIRDHVANLNLIFNGLNPGGVVFDLKGIATPPNDAWEVIGHNCLNETAVRRSAFFDPGAINLYYHARPDVASRCCAAGDMIFVGSGAPLGRLPHEIGHSLGLRGESDGSGYRYEDGHADSLQAPNPFTDANIMWRGNTPLRRHLTLGQIAWMHGSGRSALTRLRNCSLAPGPLPRWTDDAPGRRPASEPRGLEAALASRFERMLAYWDDGRRPEGRPGSASAGELVQRHNV